MDNQKNITLKCQFQDIENNTQSTLTVEQMDADIVEYFQQEPPKMIQSKKVSSAIGFSESARKATGKSSELCNTIHQISVDANPFPNTENNTDYLGYFELENTTQATESSRLLPTETIYRQQTSTNTSHSADTGSLTTGQFAGISPTAINSAGISPTAINSAGTSRRNRYIVETSLTRHSTGNNSNFGHLAVPRPKFLYSAGTSNVIRNSTETFNTISNWKESIINLISTGGTRPSTVYSVGVTIVYCAGTSPTSEQVERTHLTINSSSKDPILNSTETNPLIIHSTGTSPTVIRIERFSPTIIYSEGTTIIHCAGISSACKRHAKKTNPTIIYTEKINLMTIHSTGNIIVYCARTYPPTVYSTVTNSNIGLGQTVGHSAANIQKLSQNSSVISNAIEISTETSNMIINSTGLSPTLIFNNGTSPTTVYSGTTIVFCAGTTVTSKQVEIASPTIINSAEISPVTIYCVGPSATIICTTGTSPINIHSTGFTTVHCAGTDPRCEHSERTHPLIIYSANSHPMTIHSNILHTTKLYCARTSPPTKYIT